MSGNNRSYRRMSLTEQTNKKQFYTLFQNLFDFHWNYHDVLIITVITQVINAYFSSKSGVKPAPVYILGGNWCSHSMTSPRIEGEGKDAFVFVNVFLCSVKSRWWTDETEINSKKEKVLGCVWDSRVGRFYYQVWHFWVVNCLAPLKSWIFKPLTAENCVFHLPRTIFSV